MIEFEKASFEWSGVVIMEPVTAITDFMVSAVCFFAFIQLGKRRESDWVHKFFRYYFLTLGFSTLYGGLAGHALSFYLGHGWKFPGWVLGMTCVALIERMSIFHARYYMRPSVGRAFAMLNIAEFIALLIVTFATLNFFFVEVHAAYGLLLVVASFEIFIWMKTKSPASKYILMAIGISTLAACVHLTGFIIHKWFNHLDLSHVLMMISAWVFYKGAKKIEINHVRITGAAQ